MNLPENKDIEKASQDIFSMYTTYILQDTIYVEYIQLTCILYNLHW